MNCVFCRSPNTQIVDSRTVADSTRRRRKCKACGRRFPTVETLIGDTPKPTANEEIKYLIKVGQVHILALKDAIAEIEKLTS